MGEEGEKEIEKEGRGKEGNGWLEGPFRDEGKAAVLRSTKKKVERVKGGKHPQDAVRGVRVKLEDLD